MFFALSYLYSELVICRFCSKALVQVLARKVKFFELFEVMTKEYVVVTFLTILEMCRRNEIKLTQDDAFGEIMCEVNDG